jgi:hypothetical protein
LKDCIGDWLLVIGHRFVYLVIGRGFPLVIDWRHGTPNGSITNKLTNQK